MRRNLHDYRADRWLAWGFGVAMGSGTITIGSGWYLICLASAVIGFVYEMHSAAKEDAEENTDA